MLNLRRRRARSLLVGLVLVAAGCMPIVPITYQGFQYTGASEPTADKPQSKLWYNDGAWWALMLAPSGRIQVFELLSDHTWRDTGTVVDDRPASTGDAFWDQGAGKLYVGSRVSSGVTRLARLTYSSAARSYSMDANFPAQIHANGSESLTIAKDSTGIIWATFRGSGKILVTHTVLGSDDRTWTTPFQPAGGTPACVSSDITCVTSDDISAVTAFNGKVGVLWSNQRAGHDNFYFATHVDATPDNVWTSEVAFGGPDVADDHMNIKNVVSATDGRLFAAVKTSKSSSGDPLMVLLVRSLTGQWTNHTYSTAADDQTRPLVLVDESNRHLYMFAAKTGGSSAIRYKRTSLDAIAFGTGPGTPFVQFEGANNLNDPSSMKQVIDSTTNVVVLASDATQTRYYHAELNI
jgi:hypothetical protein